MMKRKIYVGAILAGMLIIAGILTAMLADNSAPAANGREVPTPYGQYHEALITECKPQGWLAEFLNRQRAGLTGHPDVLSYPYNTCLWAGEIKRIGEDHGDNWWRYEQTAYYTDGLLRLGYLLGDTAMINKAKEGIRYTLDHPRPDGRLGFELFTSQWPIAVFFRAMQAEYQATGDEHIVKALHRHYLSYTPAELGSFNRAIVNIEGALWIYGKTKDRKLLQLSENAYALGGFALNIDSCLSPKGMHTHGVSYMEMVKLPAILYSFTGNKKYLDAALNAMHKLDRDNMLPDGVPSSNEHLDNKDPLQSHETCDITDYTWATGYLLMVTGNATWADHIEKAIFNAGPGAVSKDFKNLQYFSSVNQVIATGNSNQNSFQHGSTWMAYWPCHETECCAGNVHRFMPNYVARMWLRDTSGQPVAALYGPSVETVNTGKEVFHITETTAYPFEERIRFNFDMAKPVAVSFTFRIPAWCKRPALNISGKRYTGELKQGTFVTLKRQFTKNDVITLDLPMETKLIDWDGRGQAVERGPLLYAFPVPEKVTVDTAAYANLGGKRSPDSNFPALDIRPAGSWNYMLDVKDGNAGSRIQVIKRKRTGYPLDPGGSPLQIRVPAKMIKDWSLQDGRYTPTLPQPGKFETEGSPTMITLVPYGSTRLRLSVFPKAR